MPNVTIVAYGDEIHVYPAGDARAGIVYMVAIGANLDAVSRTISDERLSAVCDAVCAAAPEATVHDHR